MSSENPGGGDGHDTEAIKKRLEEIGRQIVDELAQRLFDDQPKADAIRVNMDILLERNGGVDMKIMAAGMKLRDRGLSGLMDTPLMKMLLGEAAKGKPKDKCDDEPCEKAKAKEKAEPVCDKAKAKEKAEPPCEKARAKEALNNALNDLAKEVDERKKKP